MSDFIYYFGVIVCKLCEMCMWLQEQLVEYVGLNCLYVGEIECGEVIVLIVMVDKIVCVFDVLILMLLLGVYVI